MVPFRQLKPKKPSPLFSVLDLVRILCSGCFGRLDCFKKPFPPAIPAAKLNLNMDNLVLNSYFRDGGENLHSSMDCVPDAVHSPPSFSDDNEVTDDAGIEDSDEMFHGHFLLGSKVLTEVELQSPVEENGVLATAIRSSSRRSANSSRASSARDLDEWGLPHAWGLGLRKGSDSSYASSTRELYLGSSQVCLADSDSASSLGVSAVISSSREVEGNPVIVPSLGEESCTGPKKGICAAKFASLSVSHASSSSQQLCKSDDAHVLTVSFSPSDDLFVKSALRESCNRLDEEKRRFSSDGKQSKSTRSWNKGNSRSGSAPECSIPEAPLKNEWRATDEKHTLLQDGQDNIIVGSLPGCRFNLLDERKQITGDSRRLRTRSLTDQDFTELKGCIDLGFVFPEDRVPDLCETLPALEICYAVAHGAISPVGNMDDLKCLSPGSPPISPWRIAIPGDQPQQVKARLRQWAQAVACNVRHPS